MEERNKKLKLEFQIINKTGITSKRISQSGFESRAVTPTVFEKK